MAKLKNTFTQLQTGSVNAYEKDNVLFVERIDKNGKITAAVNCGNTEYFIENKKILLTHNSTSAGNNVYVYKGGFAVFE